jgi:hypothetical protein
MVIFYLCRLQAWLPWLSGRFLSQGPDSALRNMAVVDAFLWLRDFPMADRLEPVMACQLPSVRLKSCILKS